ncbi:hypothetical protein C2W62_53850, partial [Candidatus Entotheonella serta]
DTIDDWSAHKAAVEDGILKHLEHLIPGITERMVVKLSASAQTTQNKAPPPHLQAAQSLGHSGSYPPHRRSLASLKPYRSISL